MLLFVCALLFAAEQLWRLISSGNGSHAVSNIQNYIVTANLVIDVPHGKPGVPLQMNARLDNDNQQFYIDTAQ